MEPTLITMLPLSLVYTCFALVILLVVFLVALRVRGLIFALAATGVTFVGLFALFATLVIFVTSRM